MLHVTMQNDTISNLFFFPPPCFFLFQTINDVITGIVVYGTRLYMEEVNKETCNGKCCALVLFNTRALGGSYKSVSDMIRPNADMPWGNHFTFLPVSLPKLTKNKSNNPLYFVKKAHQLIDRKRNSASVWLTSKLLDLLRKLKGPEVCSFSTLLKRINLALIKDLIIYLLQVTTFYSFSLNHV